MPPGPRLKGPESSLGFRPSYEPFPDKTAPTKKREDSKSLSNLRELAGKRTQRLFPRRKCRVCIASQSVGKPLSNSSDERRPYSVRGAN
jgi:hypothetical protein